MAWVMGKINRAEEDRIEAAGYNVQPLSDEAMAEIWSPEAVAQEKEESAGSGDKWVMVYVPCDIENLLDMK